MSYDAFSAAVKLADLDDFLSPAQSCILPLLNDENKVGRQNVADRSSRHSTDSAFRTSPAAHEASVRPSISHPPGYDRARKTTRGHTENTQDIVARVLPTSCSAPTNAPSSSLSSSAVTSTTTTVALPDGGAGLLHDITPTAAGGDSATVELTGNKYSYREGRSSNPSEATTREAILLAGSYDRPSLIKLGKSRFANEGASSSASTAGGGSTRKINGPSSAVPAASSSFSGITGGPAAVVSAAATQQDTKQVARVGLYDCLACKGCVTSAEAILVERHSIDEFLRRTAAAARSTCYVTAAATGNPNDAAAESMSATGAVTASSTAAEVVNGVARTGEETGATGEQQRLSASAVDVSPVAAVAASGAQQSNDVLPRLVVVSISPQSLTALQEHFEMRSAAVTLRKLSSLFRLAGATHVLHTAVGDALSVLEVEREFINRCRQAGIGRPKDAGIKRQENKRTATAAAADPRAETPQQRASEPAIAQETQTRKLKLAAAAAEEAAGGIAAAGEAGAGVAAADVLTPGTSAAEKPPPGLTPRGQTPGKEVAVACPAEGSYSSDTADSSDMKNSIKEDDGSKRSVEFNPGLPAYAVTVTAGAEPRLQQGEEERPHREEQQRNPLWRQQEEQLQQGEQQQWQSQQQQIHQQRLENRRQQQDQQDGNRGVFHVSSSSLLEEKATDSHVLPLLASFCPGFVCYAETSYDAPLLLQHMSRVRSGQQIQGILVKGLLLELHNAAAFLLRSAALTGAFSCAGIPPLLLQALVRKSPYAAHGHHISAAGCFGPGPAAGAAAAFQMNEEREWRGAETQNDVARLQQPQWTQDGAANTPVINGCSNVLSFDGKSLGVGEEIRPEDVFHVCVMPCFDKKLEAARPEFRRPMSRAATTWTAASAAATFPVGGAALERRGERVDIPPDAKEEEFTSPPSTSSTNRYSNSSNSSSSSSISDEDAVADVDLVLATNEVPVLLQRMNVLFSDLPETHVDTFLDFFTLRSRLARAALPSHLAAASASAKAAAAAEGGTGVGGAAGEETLVDTGHTNEAASSNNSSNTSDLTSPSSGPDIPKEKVSLIVSPSASERPSNLGCIYSAAPLLPRLRSLMMPPSQLLLHPTAAITPYLNIKCRWLWWWWCRICSFGNDTFSSATATSAGAAEKKTKKEEVSAEGTAATSARGALTRERLLLAIFSSTRPPQRASADVMTETLPGHLTWTKTYELTGSAEVQDNYINAPDSSSSTTAASGCFISSQQMCGSGGYAERVFRRAAKELFGVDLEGPLIFAKRKKGDKGYKEAVLVVNGEEKLRVAIAYGFKNIQNVVQKLKRQRKLEARLSPAAAVTAAAAVATTDVACAASTTATSQAKDGGRASATGAIQRHDIRMQSRRRTPQHSEKEKQQQEEKQQEGEQGRKGTLRSLPHFIEFAACPGGCLCGGGQKLETTKDRSSSSSAAVASCHVVAGSSLSSAEYARRKDTSVENMHDGSNTAVVVVGHQHPRAVDPVRNNALVRERKNSTHIFSEENEINASSSKCVYYPAGSDHVSLAVSTPVDAAADHGRATERPGQEKLLERLTRLLHDCHVYCDPTQRLEVQLAYLYLFNCAEGTNKRKQQQGQQATQGEAEMRQTQQQEPRTHMHHEEQQQQHPEQREFISQVGNLECCEKTLQHQQNDEGGRPRVELIPWQEEARPQRELHRDDQQQQQLESRKNHREGKHDAQTDSKGTGNETTDTAEAYVASLYLPVAATRTTRKHAGGIKTDALSCFASLLCCEKTSLAIPSVPPTRYAIPRCAASDDTARDTTAETPEATSSESPLFTKATNGTERASTNAAEVSHAHPPSAWWDGFGGNRTAVKLLRTRFRDIWGGKKQTKQPQKGGGAAVSDVNFSSRPAQHRATDAKPSLHW